MRPRIPPGTRPSAPLRLTASTFVELTVTVFLLSVFAALAFPIFWGAMKSSTSHSDKTATQRAALTLSVVLPKLCEEVRPPYWESTDKVFLSSGTEWRARYWNGKEADYLILQKENDSRLRLMTPESSISIDHLNGLEIDWWKQEKRIIGFKVRWQNDNKTVGFHASWGSLIL